MFARIRRRYGASAIVTFAGAAISALGSVSGMPAAVVVFGALMAAGGALWSSGERAEFERMLRRRADEIARLNRQIAASVTGGDSFCFLAMGVFDHINNVAFAMVFHRGNHPLYDVTLTIIESVDMQRAKQASFEELSRIRTEFPVGNMTQGETRLWRNWQLPDKEESYEVFIKARNGTVRQRLKLKKVNGLWVSATQVTRTTEAGTSTVLHKRVDDGFPLNEQGEVDWVDGEDVLGNV